MKGSFIVSLYEILIYLIPGFIILFSLFILTRNKWSFEFIKEPVWKTIIILVFSFLIGLINHNISSISFTVFEKGLKKISNYTPTYDRITDYFPHKEIVKKIIYNKLNDTIEINNFDIYRYSLTLVSENSNNEINRIERLSYLQLFSRNSILPILFLIFTLFKLKVKNMKWKNYIYYFILSFFLSLILFKSYRNYGTAKALAVYRTLLMIENDKKKLDLHIKDDIIIKDIKDE